VAGEERRAERKPRPSCATLSTTVLAGSNLVSNPGLRRKQPALNRSSHGMVFGTEVKTDFNRSSSPYRAVNTLSVGYKNQSVNAV
jgi:hypothetical protein